MNQDVKQKIYESIMMNSDAQIDIDDHLNQYEPVGSPLETGMIKFLIKYEQPIHQMSDLEKHGKELCYKYPFNSKNRFMFTIHRVNHTYKLVVKGDPDLIVPSVVRYLDPSDN